MRHLPPGSSSEALGEVAHLRYQIARADALLHAADDLLERVGEDHQRREHVAHLVEHVVHLVDLAKQATATALAMGSGTCGRVLGRRAVLSQSWRARPASHEPRRTCDRCSAPLASLDCAHDPGQHASSVGSWSPMIPVEVDPSEAGGDTAVTKRIILNR